MISSDVFLLADHADAVDGKLFVAGGAWDRYLVEGFPAAVQHLSVAISLIFDDELSETPHIARLSIWDPSGTQVITQSLETQFRLNGGDRVTAESGRLNFVFTLNGLPLEQEGAYEFELHIDGKPLANTKLDAQMAAVPTPLNSRG